MTDITGNSAALAAYQPRTNAVSGIVELSRESGGNPARSVSIDGVDVRADRIAVAASARFAAQISELGAFSRNAGEAASVLDVADAGLTEIDSRLARMEELAERGALTPIVRADGSTMNPREISARDRAILTAEFARLRDEVDDIAGSTRFRDTDLLQGDPAAPTDPLELTFETSQSAADHVTVSLDPADAASLSANLETASLASEAASDAALAAVEEARESVDAIQAAIRGARAQLDGVEDAGGEVSAVVDRVREIKATPEIAIDLSRVVADRVAEEGGVRLTEGAEKLLQEVLLRMSSAPANGGRAAGGDGIEAFGGKTSSAPAAQPATATATPAEGDG